MWGSFEMDLQELDLWMLTGFSWRRIGSSDMLCENREVPILQEAGWAQGRSGRAEILVPTEIFFCSI